MPTRASVLVKNSSSLLTAALGSNGTGLPQLCGAADQLSSEPVTSLDSNPLPLVQRAPKRKYGQGFSPYSKNRPTFIQPEKPKEKQHPPVQVTGVLSRQNSRGKLTKMPPPVTKPISPQSANSSNMSSGLKPLGRTFKPPPKMNGTNLATNPKPPVERSPPVTPALKRSPPVKTSPAVKLAETSSRSSHRGSLTSMPPPDTPEAQPSPAPKTAPRPKPSPSNLSSNTALKRTSSECGLPSSVPSKVLAKGSSLPIDNSKPADESLVTAVPLSKTPASPPKPAGKPAKQSPMTSRTTMGQETALKLMSETLKSFPKTENKFADKTDDKSLLREPPVWASEHGSQTQILRTPENKSKRASQRGSRSSFPPSETPADKPAANQPSPANKPANQSPETFRTTMGQRTALKLMSQTLKSLPANKSANKFADKFADKADKAATPADKADKPAANQLPPGKQAEIEKMETEDSTLTTEDGEDTLLADNTVMAMTVEQTTNSTVVDKTEPEAEAKDSAEWTAIDLQLYACMSKAPQNGEAARVQREQEPFVTRPDSDSSVANNEQLFKGKCEAPRNLGLEGLMWNKRHHLAMLNSPFMSRRPFLFHHEKIYRVLGIYKKTDLTEVARLTSNGSWQQDGKLYAFGELPCNHLSNRSAIYKVVCEVVPWSDEYVVKRELFPVEWSGGRCPLSLLRHVIQHVIQRNEGIDAPRVLEKLAEAGVVLAQVHGRQTLVDQLMNYSRSLLKEPTPRRFRADVRVAEPAQFYLCAVTKLGAGFIEKIFEWGKETVAAGVFRNTEKEPFEVPPCPLSDVDRNRIQHKGIVLPEKKEGCEWLFEFRSGREKGVQPVKASDTPSVTQLSSVPTTLSSVPTTLSSVHTNTELKRTKSDTGMNGYGKKSRRPMKSDLLAILQYFKDNRTRQSFRYSRTITQSGACARKLSDQKGR